MLPELPETTLYVIGIVVGMIGVPVITFIKKKIGATGKAAFWLTVAVSFLLGFLSIVIVGGFKIPTTYEELITMILMVFAASQAAYYLLKKE